MTVAKKANQTNTQKTIMANVGHEYKEFAKRFNAICADQKFSDIITVAFWKIYQLEKYVGFKSAICGGGTPCAHAKNQHVHKPSGTSKKACAQKPKKCATKGKSNPKPNGQKARKAAPKNKPSARKAPANVGKNTKGK